jgi:hypothetical protein
MQDDDVEIQNWLSVNEKKMDLYSYLGTCLDNIF